MAYQKMFHSLWLLALIFFPICNSTDTLTPTLSLRDGEQLISAGEIFVLGFFSPGNSKNRYVGIWHKKVSEQTVLWVVNRENPAVDSSGVLTIKGGNLALLDGGHNNTTLWSTNISTVSNYSNAKLMDSGNLVLKDDRGIVLWQSFDYPTNTFFPNMKLGLDRRTGLNRVLTSWKSADDPARGEFSLGLDPRGIPQFFLRKGSDLIWRSGPWQNGVPVMNSTAGYNYSYVSNEDEIYFTFSLNKESSSMTTRFFLGDTGIVESQMWNEKSSRWSPLWGATQDRCDRYANCGAYGSCDSSRVAECECLRGFEPSTPRNWKLGLWSDGCRRRIPLDCGGLGKGDGFLRLSPVKAPDTSRSRIEPGLSLEACKEKCLKNCSCTAYADARIFSAGSGCVIWYADLVDLRLYSDGGQDVYIRMSASELASVTYSRGSQSKKKLLVTILIVVPVVFLFIICGYWWRRKSKGSKMNEGHDIVFNDNDIKENGKGAELSFFDVSVIAAATNDFSKSNLLGEGGFGPVYKGRLMDGQEIAVKRLSKNSGQGIEEFKNEVTLISKLQHRNLVRLFGCCISGEEKILIYEYMRNKSLDSVIFDATRSTMLDWRKRFSIIVGIARGILYLHEDSRLRIIHRDLKVSNILLDDDMNPKISDFGMAKLFRQNQTQANTNRVVGTYGYMSPEYAMDGLFSIKSDAFSFGVILLEIVSGKRNHYHNDFRSMNLIGHVWEIWKEDRALEIVDSSMDISSSESEVLRCIHVGLLCVQEKANDRPSMSSVILMLGNETTMPSPKQPAFNIRKENCSDQLEFSSNGINSRSVNEITMTETEAR